MQNGRISLGQKRNATAQKAAALEVWSPVIPTRYTWSAPRKVPTVREGLTIPLCETSRTAYPLVGWMRSRLGVVGPATTAVSSTDSGGKKSSLPRWTRHGGSRRPIDRCRRVVPSACPHGKTPSLPVVSPRKKRSCRPVPAPASCGGGFAPRFLDRPPVRARSSRCRRGWCHPIRAAFLAIAVPRLGGLLLVRQRSLIQTRRRAALCRPTVCFHSRPRGT